MTLDEIQQDKQTRYLFDKFDADNSGGLDNEELSQLFNEFHIDVDDEMVEKMFGKDNHFTLDSFLKMNNSKQKLEKYFKAMKKVQKKLLIMAGNRRRYMPVTFDEMMVNLGYHCERKEIREDIDRLDE